MGKVDKETLIRGASDFYNLPKPIARIIYEKGMVTRASLVERIFCGITIKRVPYDDIDAYYDAVKMFSEIYHNDPIMGRRLPYDSSLSIEVNDYLDTKGVQIVYHPNYGMQILQTLPNNQYE